MNDSKTYYYTKISEAIAYLEQNFTQQPSLDQIAKEIGMSPFHFQKLFSEWVGISPKKYLQYISVSYAKKLLKEKTLASTAHEIGLSGTGRLHDLFVNIEAMTPGEFKKGAKTIAIDYEFYDTLFGEILIASTSKGICHIGFIENKKETMEDLVRRFPFALIKQAENEHQEKVLPFFHADWNNLEQVKLHLKATPFQLKVWCALLKIKRGELSCYGDIAQQIGNPNASRAVGTAIGSNPIAYLIPCHRVIQSTGVFGNYFWGNIRKRTMLGWEIADSKKHEKDEEFDL